jgi:hypothetical protein
MGFLTSKAALYKSGGDNFTTAKSHLISADIPDSTQTLTLESGPTFKLAFAFPQAVVGNYSYVIPIPQNTQFKIVNAHYTYKNFVFLASGNTTITINKRLVNGTGSEPDYLVGLLEVAKIFADSTTDWPTYVNSGPLAICNSNYQLEIAVANSGATANAFVLYLDCVWA